jgi:chromosome segregation ATPase
MTEDDRQRMLTATLDRIARIERVLSRVPRACGRLRIERRDVSSSLMLFDSREMVRRLHVVHEARRLRAQSAETRLQLQHNAARLRDALGALRQKRS